MTAKEAQKIIASWPEWRRRYFALPQPEPPLPKGRPILGERKP